VIMHRYLDRLTGSSATDRETRQTLIDVFNMIKPPAALFRPHVMRAAFRGTPRSANQSRARTRA